MCTTRGRPRLKRCTKWELGETEFLFLVNLGSTEGWKGPFMGKGGQEGKGGGKKMRKVHGSKEKFNANGGANRDWEEKNLSLAIMKTGGDGGNTSFWLFACGTTHHDQGSKGGEGGVFNHKNRYKGTCGGVPVIRASRTCVRHWRTSDPRGGDRKKYAAERVEK